VGSTVSRLLTIVALAWVAILITAPVLLAHGFVVLPAIIYEAAGLVCHQKPERSFHLLGIQLPVCARCFGLYASGAAGAWLALLTGAAAGHSRSKPMPIAFALAALPTAATVALEWAGLMHPSGALRALAAFPLGAIAGWVFVRSLSAQGPAPRPLPQVRYHS
jgi:uncharacterized membrane protein